MADDAAKDDGASTTPDGAATGDGPESVAPPHAENPEGEGRRSTELSAPHAWRPTRTMALCAAILAPGAVIVLSVFSVVRDTARRGTNATSAPPVETPRAVELPASGTAMGVASSGEPPAETAEVSSPVLDDETDDGEPRPAKRTPPRHFSTVQEAAAGSCSTASVEGLSRQIIEQARCIKPNAFVPLPRRPNLAFATNVFPYLELDARNHLLQVLDAHRKEKMTINSALRTVAQQYLVWRWSAGKHCGVQLATLPGESNHEIGVALDIAEHAQWRPALEAQEFHWLGTSDRVHFDYKGGNKSPRGGMDVLAFQTLWNRNHPDDPIAADGHYSPATEERLRKAPPGGFPIGPTCGKASVPKH